MHVRWRIATLLLFGPLACTDRNVYPQVWPEPVVEWRLLEEARLGSQDDADQSLTRVGNVAIGSGGRLYIAQPEEGLIRIFGAGGEPVRIVGRRGQGPGEFVGMSRIGVADGRLYASDDANLRLSVFAADGEFIESENWSSVQVPPARGEAVGLIPTAPHILLDDGTALVKPHIFARGSQGPQEGVLSGELRVPILRISRITSRMDTVAWEVNRNVLLVMHDQGERYFIPQPFRTSPLTVLMPDGSGVVTIDPGAPARSARPAFSVARIEAGGDTAFAREYGYDPVAVSEHALLRELRDITEKLPQRTNRLSIDQIRRALQSHDLVPDVLPPVSGLAGGQDGSIWIRRESAGDTVVWTMLDPDGNVVGNVRLPAAQIILNAAEDSLVVLELDELGVPYVLRYRVER